MERKKGTGTIEEVTSKPDKNGKLFYKPIIDGKTYNAFDRTEAFNQLKAGDFPAGTVASFEYTETKVGEYTCKNLVELTKVEGAKAEAFVQKTTETRNKTGDQIVRMNALTNAIGFFSLNKEVVAMNLKKGESLNAATDEKMVTQLAETFEKWVKRQSQSLTQNDFQ